MNKHGELNTAFSGICRHCNNQMQFEAEPYPGIRIVRICDNCGELNFFKLNENEEKNSKRNKIQDKQLQIQEAIIDVFLSIDMVMGVRQICYQLSSMGVIDKTEKDFDAAENILRMMRWRGWLDFSAITDETRFQIGIDTYRNSKDFLDHVSLSYRKSLWEDKNTEVVIFIEKLGLAGIFKEVTMFYDVKVWPFRGFNSLSTINLFAQKINKSQKKIAMYHFGDHDPSGVCAANIFPDTLVKMKADTSKFTFERVAIKEHQIHEWNLPTRPTKLSDQRSKTFKGESCELDAIKPDKLKSLVESCILNHISISEIEHIKAIEQTERNVLSKLSSVFDSLPY